MIGKFVDDVKEEWTIEYIDNAERKLRISVLVHVSTALLYPSYPS